MYRMGLEWLLITHVKGLEGDLELVPKERERMRGTFLSAACALLQ